MVDQHEGPLPNKFKEQEWGCWKFKGREKLIMAVL